MLDRITQRAYLHLRLQKFKQLAQGRDRVTIEQLQELPEYSTNPFVARMFETFDTNDDGTVSMQEFAAALKTFSNKVREWLAGLGKHFLPYGLGAARRPFPSYFLMAMHNSVVHPGVTGKISVSHTLQKAKGPVTRINISWLMC